MLSWWGSIYVSGPVRTGLEPVEFIAAVFSIAPEKVYIVHPIDWLVYILLVYFCIYFFRIHLTNCDVHAIAYRDAFSSSMNALNYSVLTVCLGQFFERELDRLPPFNQILREGLILRRLTLITGAPDEKTGQEGGEDNAGNDSIEEHEPKPSFVGVNDQAMDARISRLRGSLSYGRDEWEAGRVKNNSFGEGIYTH